MKSPLLTALVLLAPLLTVFAQPEAVTAAPPSVSVSGTAEVKVTPDLIDVRLEVEALDSSLDTAHGLNELRVAGVLKLLKDLGVEEKDVRTDLVRIEPVYNDGNGSQARPGRFRVRRSVRCTLHDMKLLSPVLRGVIGQGVTQAPDIGFRSSGLRKHQDQALVEAVRAAKEKATLLAGELGGRPGRTLRISERAPGGSWSWNSGMNACGCNARHSAFQASGGTVDGEATTGWISVSVTVDVTFVLE
ncbi:MAG: DUF541 domain-containing protein [Verrucomicrobiaceae bacterium]|nr:MAG: DUF541 domain-containing protein [Verrucomicrobiaceae bacterium]